MSEACEEATDVRAALDGSFGPCPPDSPERVRVAAANQSEGRGARPSARDLLDERVVLANHRAVSRFDRRHCVQQLEVGLERELTPVEVEQMIEHEEDAGLAQPSRHLEHIAAERLQLAVQPFVHPVNAEVDLDVALRQPARHFLGDEEVGSVRMAVQILEAAANRVVVGDRHEVHAARLGDTVNVLGT